MKGVDRAEKSLSAGIGYGDDEWGVSELVGATKGRGNVARYQKTRNAWKLAKRDGVGGSVGEQLERKSAETRSDDDDVLTMMSELLSVLLQCGLMTSEIARNLQTRKLATCYLLLATCNLQCGAAAHEPICGTSLAKSNGLTKYRTS